MNKQALGRGLESLIPRAEKGNEVCILIDAADISPNPFQPRKTFEEEKLNELAASFIQNGIIQPLTVRKTAEGYQLIAGERRLQAAKLAGIARVPAVIRDAGDMEMLKLSLVENIQRDDLNPLEEALSYSRLIEEFGVNREELSGTLGKSRAAVANTIRILNLPQEIKDEIVSGRISRGHAIALLGLELPDAQRALAKKIISEGLSVRETERLVKKRSGRAAPPAGRQKPPEISAIEERLRLVFGTRVNISTFRKGGRIEIEYYSDGDLNRILETLDAGTR